MRVTRAALPLVAVVAVEERVTGPFGAVTVSRTGPTERRLAVQAHMVDSRSGRGQDLTFWFERGQSSVTGRVQVGDNRLVEDDITVTWTLQAGKGYAVSEEQASASVVVEESDVPRFWVEAAPTRIAEGGSATVTVSIANGVRFREDQRIDLAVSGTASAADYGGLPAALTLAARATSVTAEVAALTDQQEETDETVTITATHDGSSSAGRR